MSKEEKFFNDWMEENQFEYNDIPIADLLSDYEKELAKKMPSDEEIQIKAEINYPSEISSECEVFIEGAKWIKSLNK